MIVSEEEYLAHYGVKGMKWGVRKARNVARNVGAMNRAYNPAYKAVSKYANASAKGARTAGSAAKKVVEWNNKMAKQARQKDLNTVKSFIAKVQSSESVNAMFQLAKRGAEGYSNTARSAGKNYLNATKKGAQNVGTGVKKVVEFNNALAKKNREADHEAAVKLHSAATKAGKAYLNATKKGVQTLGKGAKAVVDLNNRMAKNNRDNSAAFQASKSLVVKMQANPKVQRVAAEFRSLADDPAD